MTSLGMYEHVWNDVIDFDESAENFMRTSLGEISENVDDVIYHMT